MQPELLFITIPGSFNQFKVKLQQNHLKIRKMKKNIVMTIAISFLFFIAFSCKKESQKEILNANLKKNETLLQQSYQVAKTNDNLLKLHVSPDGQFTEPNVMMEDSLYHLNDSLCNLYYLTYCEIMIDGDNMMGGNMMGGNTMHGNNMMGSHTFMGDTSTINQYFRDLNLTREAHPAHHPVSSSSDHELHHP